VQRNVNVFNSAVIIFLVGYANCCAEECFLWDKELDTKNDLREQWGRMGRKHFKTTGKGHVMLPYLSEYITVEHSTWWNGRVGSCEAEWRRKSERALPIQVGTQSTPIFQTNLEDLYLINFGDQD
jgi:hypothetical protein